jgi:excisionase family DNA binding protein
VSIFTKSKAEPVVAEYEVERQYDILSVEEVQELLPFSRRVIYGRLRDGTLPGFKMGRRWFMRRKDIDAILKG